jgi:peptidoglycan/xylan/chitin deacetylase (PgdA/CDA1 family)
LVSLEETQRRIRGEANRRVSVSITFDDGYSENCRHAIPLLVKEGIPCTYFITVRNVLENQPFDHDLEQGYCFAPNTVEQIKAMAAAGIEIGVHGWDHVNLGLVADRQVLHHEVVTAKQELRAMLGRPARYFAFPYGHYAALSREAFDLAARAGYEAACSAYGGFNVPGDDAFHLQRIVADNSMLRLKNWTTFDPRKRRIVRFEYLAPRKPYVSTTSPSTRG